MKKTTHRKAEIDKDEEELKLNDKRRKKKRNEHINVRRQRKITEWNNFLIVVYFHNFHSIRCSDVHDCVSKFFKLCVLVHNR